MRRITISTQSTGLVYARFTKENPETADAIWNALPIEGGANIWGDEIYFSTPINQGMENARAVVELGEIGYWPRGKAFCIFFGKTPASMGNEIRAASPVNIFAKIVSSPKIFKNVRNGELVKIEKAD